MYLGCLQFVGAILAAEYIPTRAQISLDFQLSSYVVDSNIPVASETNIKVDICVPAIMFCRLSYAMCYYLFVYRIIKNQNNDKRNK